tara:strand:+ start:18937 stop:20043 length:1107 start_codon:yes stop_codon:yes gene_type:complete
MGSIDYRRRWRAVKRFLSNNNYDAYLVSRPANIRWLSDSNSSPGSPPSASLAYAIIPKKGKPIGLSSTLEQERVRKFNAISNLKIFGPYEDLSRDAISSDIALKNLAKENAWSSICFDTLSTKFRGIKSKQVAEIEKLRMVKDQEELKRIKSSISVSDKAQRFTRHLVECGEGLTEKEVASEIDYFMRRKNIQENSFGTIVASGYNSAFPHHNNSNKRLKNGEPVICDFGVFMNGYCSDITRTYFVGGETTDYWKKRYNAVLEAQQRSFNRVSNGQSGHDVDSAGRDYLRKLDFAKYFVHGTGHGFGLEIHESPSMTFKSKDILRKNMTITIEPGIYIPKKGGIRIEDDILVTKDHAITLTKAARNLF